MQEERVGLRLHAATWNVGACGAPPPADALLPWLAGGAADVIAVGLQEAVDINSMLSYVGDLGSGGLSADGLDEPLAAEIVRWQAALAAALPGHRLLARKALVGMALFVFIAEAHARSCSARVAALGTGPLGAGNKGAVACSLRVHGSTLCLMCSHLAAGKKERAARNREAAVLLGELGFADPRIFRSAGVPPPRSVGAHDFVVWLGDFNYRIEMPDDEVRWALGGAAVGADELAELASRDGLRQERAAGRAFAGFVEGPLAFLPTYKYDVGTDRFDTSAKKRAPAWCDRVLWRESEHVRGLSYERHELRHSDHRPVAAALQLSVAAESRLEGAPPASSSAVAPPPSSLFGQAAEACATCSGPAGCLGSCLRAFSSTMGGGKPDGTGRRDEYRAVPQSSQGEGQLL